MGSQYLVKCSSCEEESVVRSGGGLNFFLLHCDLCGVEKSIYLGEIPKEYRPPAVYRWAYEYCLPKSNRRKLTGIVEQIAGVCMCGGNFKRAAQPRCKNCKSDQIHRIKSLWDIMYS